MALKFTILKADLQISYMDRGYYGTHALTIVRHHAETDERMMVLRLAFALHADPALSLGKGVSIDDEPDLWQKDLTGAIDLWIDVGQPDERRILKACGDTGRVVVYSYSSASAIWWSQAAEKLERAKNLDVFNFPAEACQALAGLAKRGMQLQCTIRDGVTRGSVVTKATCRSSLWHGRQQATADVDRR